MRKSTVILIISIVVTIILGTLAILTANLLQKRKVAEEKAKAAVGNYCGPLSFTVDESQTGVIENGKKFQVKISAKNERSSGSIYIKLKTFISQCMKKGRDICAEKLLLGADDATWQDGTLTPGETKWFTFTANTAFPEKCGRFQYDVILLDVKEGSGNGSRIDECNLDKWASTAIIDTGTDCNACSLSASSNKIQEGGSVNLTANVYTGGIFTSSTWIADISGGSFNPTTGTHTKYTAKYTAPQSIPENVAKINVTFSGNFEKFPEEPKSATYGGGYNGLKTADSVYYLPGVANNLRSSNDWPSIDRTHIYIFNPNSSPTTVSLSFLNSNGQENTRKSVNIDPNGTAVVETGDIFGPQPFYGTVIVAPDNKDKKLIVNYEKLENGFRNSWTMEGIPATDTSTTVFLSPVTTKTMNWGVSNHLITIFNPADRQVDLTYEFYYNDGYKVETFKTQPRTTLRGHETYIFDVNDIIPDQDPRNPQNPYWWTGQVKISTSQGRIVSISEDIGTQGVAGSKGNFGRGRTASSNPSNTLCLMPLTHNAYGIVKTGFGFSNTVGTQNPVTIRYFYSLSGKELTENKYQPTLKPYEGVHRDTGWASGDPPNFKGLPDGYHGAAMVTGSQGLIGGIQDLAATEAFGRGTVAIPCDPSNLTNKVYLTGLLAGAYGTPANSIQVFNPTDSVVTGTISLYGPTGNEDATYDFYLKPHAMDGPILWALLPPGWYGSAIIEANGKIAVTSLSHSGDLDKSTQSCSIPLTVEHGPSEEFSCTLTASPETVQKGSQVTATLSVTDTNPTRHTYTYSLNDSPDSGSFQPTSGSVTPGTPVTSNYTVSSNANPGTTTLTATVTRSDQRTATCSDTITITSQTGAVLDCTSITVSDSTPNRNQTITAQAVVTNTTGQTPSYEWSDNPVSGTFNPNNQQSVQYTVGSNASGTIILTAQVTAGSYSDTCSTTLSVQTEGRGGATQPGTAFLPPVITMFGIGGAITGAGTFLTRNARKVSTTLEKLRYKPFEQRILEVIRKRRRSI